jgi:hypothetical protein
MRIALAIPLLLLGACQVSKDEANKETTVSFNSDVAENTASDVANVAENIAADVGNDVENTADKLQNKVGKVEVKVGDEDKNTAANKQ